MEVSTMSPQPSSVRSAVMTRGELLDELDRFVETQLHLLLPIERCWQPSDVLPDLTGSDWQDQLAAWRTAAAGLTDDVLVTLVANVITEEALPSYHAWLCNLEHGLDRSGRSEGGFGRWIRGWVAEEQRHGDALSKYLYVTGRVHMRSFERTLQSLLSNGFDPQTDNNVFQAFIYTSFQERATFISHSGTGRLARACGDANLARLCELIAGDESRHEKAYERFVARLFELDPDECMIALETMLRRSIVMPSRAMTDGVDPDLFGLFSAITQRNGIYTAQDYARIMDYLVRLWKVGERSVTSAAAKRAQDFICPLPARYLRLAERAEARLSRVPVQRPISWLFGRSV